MPDHQALMLCVIQICALCLFFGLNNWCTIMEIVCVIEKSVYNIGIYLWKCYGSVCFILTRKVMKMYVLNLLVKIEMHIYVFLTLHLYL
jgi:hypothetical protein